ncbi:NAD-dependent protein deacylase [Sphingomonas antarctica]|uniref:NAD-dependent deacylase n=1 Tax=Sphingomonas antarctica TaxID=2040274 RepID=UPI0039E9C508
MTPRNIVILTGAGISAESGLATFRGPGGLWEGHRVEDVCTPDALRHDAELVHRFYDERRAALDRVEPNAAHVALARLDAEWSGELLIVTQNVDDLHERAWQHLSRHPGESRGPSSEPGVRPEGWIPAFAGMTAGGRAPRLIHMHGELKSALCAACGARRAWLEGLPPATLCADCGRPALRPDIVFFGEMPYRMEEIDAAVSRANLFVSIGTSGAVYPAAGFVRTASYHGAQTLEMNLDPSAGSIYFDTTRIGPASTLVPAWVDQLLQSTQSSPMSR